MYRVSVPLLVVDVVAAVVVIVLGAVVVDIIVTNYIYMAFSY